MGQEVANNRLAEVIRRQGFVVLDGALATELEARGARLDGGLWSARLLVAQPELIRQVHYDYFVAGADVAITASYQATFPGFAAQGIDAQAARRLMLASVALAADARDDFWRDSANRAGRMRPLVAASVGPYGAYLADGSEYDGRYGLGADALMAFHRPRLEVLAGSGADLLACETIPCCVEAEALAMLLDEVVKSHETLPPAWFSFACRNGVEVNSGELLRDCVAVAAGSPHVAAVGINCTAPEHVAALLGEARAVTDKPLIVYPNRGEVWEGATQTWQGGGVACLADYVAEWRAAGAVGIGGCCRTRPEDIEQIASRLREGLAG